MTSLRAPYRVLVLDSKDASREALAALLRSRGYEVTAEADTHAGFRMVALGCDLIVADELLAEGYASDALATANAAGLLDGTSTLILASAEAPHVDPPAHMLQLGVLRAPVDEAKLLALIEQGTREARQVQLLSAERSLPLDRAPPPQQRASPLADFIRSHVEEISAAWVERVRRLSPDGASEIAIRDHTPNLLEELAVALVSTGGHVGVASNASRHGAQRFRLGFAIEAVVREYAELRRVILELARASGLTLELDDVSAVADWMIEAIAIAARRHSDERTMSLQRLEARLRAQMALRTTAVRR